MIKLNQKISHNFSLEKPFALRVRSGMSYGDSANDVEAILDRTDDDKLVLHAAQGYMTLHSNEANLEENEVILVFPKSSTIRRFYRPSANSNNILLTEECDQVCVMCSQPPKNKRYDQFELYKSALRLIPNESVIGITGGEPTLLKDQLFVFLQQILSERPDLFFHILSNAQHFEANDRGVLSEMRNNILWGIPLYSADAQIHNQIVGKEDAFDILIDSFNDLFSAGVRIELRTVLLRQNVYELPSIAEFIATHLHWIEVWAIMQLENMGYARMNWDHIFFDNSLDSSPIQRAISVAVGRDINVALYNFPLCTIPDQCRKYAYASISDWKKKYLDCCAVCVEKRQCCGVFEWHTEKRGFSNIETLI